MNLFEYVPEMANKNSPFADAALIVIILFLVITIYKMFFGMRRGFVRQLIHLGFTALAAVISFLVARSEVDNFMKAETVEQLLVLLEGAGGGEITAILNSFDPETLEYLMSLPVATVIAPLAFTVLFMLVNLIVRIPYIILVSVLKIGKATTPAKKLGGTFFGGIEAVLVASILFLPFVAATELADGTYALAIEAEKDKDEAGRLTEEYETTIAPFASSPAFAFVKPLGTDAALTVFSTIKVEGEDTDLRDDMLKAIKLVTDASALDGTDFKNLTDKDKRALETMLDTLDSSPYMSAVFSGIISGIARSAESGAIPIEMDAPFDTLVHDLLKIFEGCDKETLTGDLGIIKDIYFILSDDGILAAMDSENGGEDMISAMTRRDEEGKTTINRLIDALKSNERTKPLVTTLTKISISLLSNSMSGDAAEGEGVPNIEEKYESVKSGVNEILNIDKEDFNTEEEYKATLSSTLDTALKDNGIELEPEIVDTIADYVDEHFSDVEELTDEDFSDIILSYYDVYLDYIDDGTVDDLPDNIGGVDIPDDINDMIENGTLPEGFEDAVLPDEYTDAIKNDKFTEN